MTCCSQPISANILEFDDDFERTLRRKRKQPEPNPPSSSSEAESEFEEEEEEEQVMAADNRTIKELSASGLDNAVPLCIQYPVAAQEKTDEFELKSSLLHHSPKYHGLSMEDLNKHLRSLKCMKKAFLEKLFPTSRVILLRKKISGIQQNQGESFPAYYERFKMLVASCPQHQMKEELLIQYFYEGLLPIERQMFDASAGGALIDKTPVAAKILIANRALNVQQYEGVGQRDIPGLPKDAKCKELHQVEQGKLPSSTVVNPKGGFETAKAITLRSGKHVGTDLQPFKSSQNEDEKLMLKEKEEIKPTSRVEKPLPQPPKAPKPSQTTKVSPNSSSAISIPLNVPFPSRFIQAKNKQDEKEILEKFRKVHVNIPLLDAIKQIPKYAKFLKKLCTIRKQISEKEVAHVSENVSTMLQRKLPPRCKDLSSFTIPCVIGNTRFENAMLDLGASINVMPYSVYTSMNLGELKNDGVIIQLADQSNAYPKEILEDVLVQVDHLIFPADFDVLDMEDSAHSPPSPFLLGRLFMKTAHIKIDVAKGALTLEFGGDMINFKVSEAIENSNDVHSSFSIDVIRNVGQKRFVPIKKDEF
ncbi:unnamed protein product [Malus baccata var. baccata]